MKRLMRFIVGLLLFVGAVLFIGGTKLLFGLLVASGFVAGVVLMCISVFDLGE